MKSLLMLALLTGTLMVSGCANFGNAIQRDLLGNTNGNYHIIKYNGGKIVEEYWLHNIKVTQNSQTDGLYFIKDGNIYEIQGDVTTVRLAHDFAGPDVWTDLTYKSQVSTQTELRGQ